MIILKSERDLEAMRPACAVATTVLDDIAAFIQPGVTTRQVDDFAASRIKHYGAKSAFLGYRKYPCQICISVNEQVVHGLAGSRVLNFGDIVSLDVGVVHNGFIGDTARTVAVGGCSVVAQKLMDVTERALHEGIAKALPGGRVVDISRAIQGLSKKTASAWCESSWGTVLGGQCTKSRRCRILWTVRVRPSCGRA